MQRRLPRRGGVLKGWACCGRASTCNRDRWLMSDVEAVIFLGRSQRCTASRTPDPGVGQRVLHEGLYIGVAGSLLAGPVLHEHVPDGLAVEPVDQLGLRGDVPDLLPRHAPSAGARHVARGRPGGTGFSGRPLSAPREYSRCRARQREIRLLCIWTRSRRCNLKLILTDSENL